MQKPASSQSYVADVVILIRFTDILRKNCERINLYLSICSSQLHFGVFGILIIFLIKSSPLLS